MRSKEVNIGDLGFGDINEIIAKSIADKGEHTVESVAKYLLDLCLGHGWVDEDLCKAVQRDLLVSLDFEVKDEEESVDEDEDDVLEPQDDDDVNEDDDEEFSSHEDDDELEQDDDELEQDDTAP